MGLIKAAVGAIGGTLKDQWKEAIRCEDLGNDILMMKKTTPTGVITNKSTIIVAPGQCAIIYDNGKVIDATAEEGFYTFDQSSSPSFFAGQFGDVFKEAWQRFTYNGASSKQQAVFFFNTKLITGNKFGTKAPVPYSDYSHVIPNQMTGDMTPLSLKVKCFGNYTFKLVNPAVFMSAKAGTADVYRKDELVEQIRDWVISSFQNVLNELGNSVHRIPVLELPSQTDEIKAILEERVYDEEVRKLGIAIDSFSVESVTLDPESQAKIDEYEHNANDRMQQGRIISAFENIGVQAKKDGSDNTGAFIGLNMMNSAAGGMFSGAMQQPQYQQPAQPTVAPQQPAQTENQATPANAWVCSNCKTTATGKFCPECGSKKTEGKFCSNCGAKLSETAKFCGECGKKVE